jgi:FKBP-type peptidyl-prolyl cis-trans isomerase
MGRIRQISWLTSVFAWLLVIGLAGCSQEDPFEKYEKQQREIDDKYIQEYLTGNNITNFTKTSTGLYYLPQQPGTGAKIQKGNTVTMHYIGKFLNGQKFESSYDSGIPRTFKVGANESIIKGWEQGALLLSNQEKATLIVPSHLGYGRYGSGSVPPGAVLVYDIDVRNVQ